MNIRLDRAGEKFPTLVKDFCLEREINLEPLLLMRFKVNDLKNDLSKKIGPVPEHCYSRRTCQTICGLKLYTILIVCDIDY